MAELNDFNEKIIAEFRENGGKVGGPFEGKPMILVHHVGAKSGKERVTPLVYLREGDRLFVFASKAGADVQPAWYHNLMAHPKTKVEVGTETLDVVARTITGPERDEIYARQCAVAPQFADYQRKTTRVIPVVEFVRPGS
ncbi:nitroreductase family deazaflavin-dependent oxidoreductase [Amycolatopsis pigmentata]|uniref:Nitroreductase family deazaflavin-dependent oxidoreductase n=1 Tax=Amycolatopsis pigmentata TaxID=450801 RepID=A0ABW5G3F6_9PSEU